MSFERADFESPQKPPSEWGSLLRLLAGSSSEDHIAQAGFFRSLVEALPQAVYATDAEGRITFYNEAAAQLWGRLPKIGEDWWCGSWRLYWPDGRPMCHDECPMALCLKTGKPVRGLGAIAERPDGTRFPFIPYPTPLYDKAGKLVGAVNMLVDISERIHTERASQHLAAIVESSDDAIISKDLNGIIQTWNKAAERMFGWSASEIIGKPVLTLIPIERHHEETTILERIRKGDRVDHYETIRQRKDGSLVDISLTVSPIRNDKGRVTGASKIARDISQRKQAEATKELLLHEIKHRVKNTLGNVQAIARQTFIRAPKSERDAFAARLQALGDVHELLTHREWISADLQELVARAMRPFIDGQRQGRLNASGPNLELSSGKSLLIALLLHELGTNAVKYGALANESGRVNLTWETKREYGATLLTMSWKETGGPPVATPRRKGFGSRLIKRGLEAEQGSAEVLFDRSGLSCVLRIPLDEAQGHPIQVGDAARTSEQAM